MIKLKVELELVDCDLCGSNDFKKLFKTRNYRLEQGDEYWLVKCNKCELILLNPRPTTESISKLYQEIYYPDGIPQILPKLETKMWKMILKKIWRKISGQYIDEIVSQAEGKVLDIGCGNGHILLPLKKKGCETFGVEINPTCAKNCNDLGLKVFCGTLEDAELPEDFFDMVIISQVLEHIPSPKQTLREIHRILKQDGKLFIYCPNTQSYLSMFFGKYWHGWHVPFHFYEFTQQTVRRLARKTGFKIIRLSTFTPGDFFFVSLNSIFYGGKFSKICLRSIGRRGFNFSLIFRFFFSCGLRIIDFFMSNKGDCLKIELRKDEKYQFSRN